MLYTINLALFLDYISAAELESKSMNNILGNSEID